MSIKTFTLCKSEFLKLLRGVKVSSFLKDSITSEYIPPCNVCIRWNCAFFFLLMIINEVFQRDRWKGILVKHFNCTSSIIPLFQIKSPKFRPELVQSCIVSYNLWPLLTQRLGGRLQVVTFTHILPVLPKSHYSIYKDGPKQL